MAWECRFTVFYYFRCSYELMNGGYKKHKKAFKYTIVACYGV